MLLKLKNCILICIFKRYFSKNPNRGQNLNIGENYKFLDKNRPFTQKSKFCSKIEIVIEKWKIVSRHFAPVLFLYRCLILFMSLHFVLFESQKDIRQMISFTFIFF